jgi:hypothetical protein
MPPCNLGDNPFVGRSVTVTLNHPTGSVGHVGRAVDAFGDFLCVDIADEGRPAIPAWFNLAHVAAIVVMDEDEG